MGPREALNTYRNKRNPGRTPEPFGDGVQMRAPSAGAPLCFCVQQHAATGMHWDVRLEMDGALVSFAVPKGVSLDKTEKRLAMLTEDHPLDYAWFEGVIPEGNYGAGGMILWDHGNYACIDGIPLRQQLADGKLDLVFHGHKMRGRWALVRIKAEKDGRHWLMFHKPPRGALTAPDLAITLPHSILSGLTVAELEAGVDRTDTVLSEARALGAEERVLHPESMTPMLAEAREKPFSHPAWLFEIKLDGIRGLVHKRGPGDVRIYTRAGREVGVSFPAVARAVNHLPVRELILDGEICTNDARGVTRFELLQQRLGLSDEPSILRAEVEYPAWLHTFDLLSVGNLDCRNLTTVQRKRLLSLFVPKVGVARLVDDLPQEGELLFDEVRRHGMEGIIGKRADARYQDGRRSSDWVKVKPVRTAEAIVVGVHPNRSNAQDVGSLLMAWWDAGTLTYCGRVGSGLDEETRKALWNALKPAAIPRMPFAPPAEKLEKDCFFVEPQHVLEVKYADVTAAGLLRHPVFVRLRPDRSPADCHAPQQRAAPVEQEENLLPVAVERPVPTVHYTNLQKVYFPRDPFTKGDLLDYYRAVWPFLAPYLKDRPVVLTRYPDGIDGKNFYQKNVPSFTPDWVETIRVEDTDYFVCNTLDTLMYVINSGAIPLHVWHSRKGSLETPDWCVLDLDPKEAPRSALITVARDIHALLEELSVTHVIKSSGQKGLHILIPVRGLVSHTHSKMLGELLARVVVGRVPHVATVERVVGARGNKVYVDFLQNGFGKLIAGIYSVRPRDGGPVSFPLRWDQVTDDLDPSVFNMRTAVPLLEKHGDPCLPVLGDPVDLERVLGALAERLQGAAR